MKKRRIVIASILKPVNDTRMLEKMAVTLTDSANCEVYIIGYPHSLIHAYANIHLISLPSFSRLSLGRWLARWKVLLKTREVKPEVLIVNTHELLIVAIINRIFFGTKIIYDIRENYYRNLMYTDAFPSALGSLLALWVRLKEKLTAEFFHHFLLAEEGYRKEMKFFRDRTTTIENKMVTDSRKRNSSQDTIRLLFSGTLAESTGVFQAIKLASTLHKVDSRIQLTIIGYCARRPVLDKLHQAILPLPFVRLIGGESLVAHPEIVNEIYNSDFGLVAYPPSRHTENSVPTKLYEYLACQLPILVQRYQPWIAICEPYDACIPVDFESPDTSKILERMKLPFYSSPPQNVTWETEGEKLVRVVETV